MEPYSAVPLQIAVFVDNCLSSVVVQDKTFFASPMLNNKFSFENTSDLDWLSSSIHPFGIANCSWIEHTTSCYRKTRHLHHKSYLHSHRLPLLQIAILPFILLKYYKTRSFLFPVLTVSSSLQLFKVTILHALCSFFSLMCYLSWWQRFFLFFDVLPVMVVIPSFASENRLYLLLNLLFHPASTRHMSDTVLGKGSFF